MYAWADADTCSSALWRTYPNIISVFIVIASSQCIFCCTEWRRLGNRIRTSGAHFSLHFWDINKWATSPIQPCTPLPLMHACPTTTTDVFTNVLCFKMIGWCPTSQRFDVVFSKHYFSFPLSFSGLCCESFALNITCLPSSCFQPFTREDTLELSGPCSTSDIRAFPQTIVYAGLVQNCS